MHMCISLLFENDYIWNNAHSFNNLNGSFEIAAMQFHQNRLHLRYTHVCVALEGVYLL